MTSPSTTPWLPQSEIETAEHLFDNWFDPIEAGLRDRAREFLQAMFEGELDGVLARLRYVRRAKLPRGGSQGAAGVIGHPPRPPLTIAAGNIRADRNRGAARPAEHRRRQDGR